MGNATTIWRLYLPINDKQRFCSNMAHLVGQRFNWLQSPHCQKLQVKATKIMTSQKRNFLLCFKQALGTVSTELRYCKHLNPYFVKWYAVLWHSREILSIYINTWREGAKKTEPGSFKWWPKTGPEVTGKSWSRESFLWTPSNTFSL